MEVVINLLVLAPSPWSKSPVFTGNTTRLRCQARVCDNAQEGGRPRRGKRENIKVKHGWNWSFYHGKVGEGKRKEQIAEVGAGCQINRSLLLENPQVNSIAISRQPHQSGAGVRSRAQVVFLIT